MKKKLAVVVTALALVAVMLIGLCACGSSWGKIKSAFEKENFHEVELTEQLKKAFGVKDEDVQEADATVHFLTTAEISEDPTLSELAGLITAKYAIVWEYKNVDELQKHYKEDLSENEQEKFGELWEKYQKSDIVNENCILVFGDSAVRDIFKGTK